MSNQVRNYQRQHCRNLSLQTHPAYQPVMLPEYEALFHLGVLTDRVTQTKEEYEEGMPWSNNTMIILKSFKF